MDRLTRYNEEGMVVSNHPTSEIMKRLAEYEDTELTPEQMVEIDKEYHLKCKEMHQMAAGQVWIPCSERLPEPGKRYLVSVVWKSKDYKTTSVYIAIYGSDGLWHTHNYEPVPYEVLAWKPLPEPYESE